MWLHATTVLANWKTEICNVGRAKCSFVTLWLTCSFFASLNFRTICFEHHCTIPESDSLGSWLPQPLYMPFTKLTIKCTLYSIKQLVKRGLTLSIKTRSHILEHQYSIKTHIVVNQRSTRHYYPKGVILGSGSSILSKFTCQWSHRALVVVALLSLMLSCHGI